MLGALLLGAAMAAQPAPATESSAANLKAYEEASANVGRDADSQVALALWCEERGLTAERVKHLTLAVLKAPNHPLARGLLGLVAHQGKWRTPEEVRDAIESDPAAHALMQEYLQRRAATADTADAQAKLARWCEERGLDDQASAHYKAVVRLDPSRATAWRKLGHQKSGGRWMRPEDIAAEKARAERRKEAEKHWRPILEKSRDALLGKDAAKRRRAEAELEAINDPAAVATIYKVFIRDDVRLQRFAAEMFGRIDGSDASMALASLAVTSAFPEVRGAAADLLRRRDPREFLGSLIDLIQKPFRYQVKSIDGSSGSGRLFVEGEQFDIQRVYQVINNVNPTIVPQRLFAPDVPMQTGGAAPLLAAAWEGFLSGRATFSTLETSNPVTVPGVPGLTIHPASQPNGATALLRAAYLNAVLQDQRVAAHQALLQERLREAQWSVEQDVAFVENLNRGIRDVNDRVLPVVVAVSGRDFGDSAEQWRAWWSDEMGYAIQSSTPAEKPVYYDYVETTILPPHVACFAAGTLVRTLEGLRPIESLRVGDKALSQNADTGAISFQPVLATHLNQPTPTLKLMFGSETIVATGIHRFWKAGKGWTMARDLTPGDAVRVLGGTLLLDSVEPSEVQPVHNLDIAENHDFFVGERGFLVYDYGIVQPPAKPFDAPAAADSL